MLLVFVLCDDGEISVSITIKARFTTNKPNTAIIPKKATATLLCIKNHPYQVLTRVKHFKNKLCFFEFLCKVKIVEFCTLCLFEDSFCNKPAHNTGKYTCRDATDNVCGIVDHKVNS